jgi:hypothetical protein
VKKESIWLYAKAVFLIAAYCAFCLGRVAIAVYLGFSITNVIAGLGGFATFIGAIAALTAYFAVESGTSAWLLSTSKKIGFLVEEDDGDLTKEG